MFENFIVSLENMTKFHEGQFTINEFQRGRESIFNVAVAFEKFALNYGKHHLPIKIVSHKMGELKHHLFIRFVIIFFVDAYSRSQ